MILINYWGVKLYKPAGFPFLRIKLGAKQAIVGDLIQSTDSRKSFRMSAYGRSSLYLKISAALLSLTSLGKSEGDCKAQR
jgi:hypothetical protein